MSAMRNSDSEKERWDQMRNPKGVIPVAHNQPIIRLQNTWRWLSVGPHCRKRDAVPPASSGFVPLRFQGLLSSHKDEGPDGRDGGAAAGMLTARPHFGLPAGMFGG